MDLIEHKPQSNRGYRWALHIVDSHTNHTWIRFVRNKSDVFNEVKAWIRRMKTQSGLKILRVRLDKGTEFAWNSLKSLSDEEGFTLGPSTLDTPAQNGKIERNGRIIAT